MDALFLDWVEPVTHYRLVQPTAGTLADHTYVSQGTVYGYIEPVAPSEELLNNQNTMGISENIFFDITYDGTFMETDGFIDSRGAQYIVKGVPESWRSLFPYVMCKVEREQFLLGV